jgi:hypothetical protein
MSIRRLVLVSLAATLVGVFLSGCGAAPGTGARDSSERSERTDGSERSDGASGSRPPRSTLSYGGETITGALGTYCWTQTPSGDDTLFSGGCADAVGVPVSEETLRVPAGSTLTFAYGGKKLDALDVSAHRIGQGNHLEKVAGGSVLVPDEGGKGYRTIRLQIHRFEDGAHVAAELPVGEYVVAAFVRVPQGDAVYGFRVVVE